MPYAWANGGLFCRIFNRYYSVNTLSFRFLVTEQLLLQKFLIHSLSSSLIFIDYNNLVQILNWCNLLFKAYEDQMNYLNDPLAR